MLEPSSPPLKQARAWMAGGALQDARRRAEGVLDALRGAGAPILITGCPRSGTTWVGTTVGESPEVLYIYEPFNNEAPHHLALDQRFLYVPPDAAADAVSAMPAVLGLGTLDRRVRSLVRAGQLGPRFRSELAPHLAAHELLRFPRKFLTAKRACIKDPLAFFAAEWLAERYDAKVVVLMRHPAGMISSYLKLGWASEAESLLQQPALYARFLAHDADLQADIARLAQAPEDHLGSLILQWKLFAHAALQLHAVHPEWLFVTHEGICREPVAHFRGLYDFLGLSFTRRIEASVLSRSGGSNETDPATHQQHMLERDSKAVSLAWKQRLDDAARTRIEDETRALWERMQAIAWRPDGAPGDTGNAPATACS